MANRICMVQRAGMSPLLRAACAMLLLSPVPALAQPATAALCRALVESAPFFRDGASIAEADGPDGCRFTELTFGVGAKAGYQVATLVEHGVPFGAPALPDHPVHLRVEARGITFVLRTGNAKVDWMNRQQQVPFDVVLDGSFDPAAGVAILTELSVEGRAIGRTVLSGELAQVDPVTLPSGAELRSVTLHSDSRRFILGYVLPTLLAFLPDEDPGGAVERARGEAIAKLRTLLPLAGATAATVEALAAFVADFPQAPRVLDLAVAATGPVTGDTLGRALADPAEAVKLMRMLRVQARYEGDAR